MQETGHRPQAEKECIATQPVHWVGWFLGMALWDVPGGAERGRLSQGTETCPPELRGQPCLPGLLGPPTEWQSVAALQKDPGSHRAGPFDSEGPRFL